MFGFFAVIKTTSLIKTVCRVFVFVFNEKGRDGWEIILCLAVSDIFNQAVLIQQPDDT